MKKHVAFAVATTCGLLSLSSVQAQTPVFNDTFSNGSTLNGTSTPGGTPTDSSTSYDIASSKADTTYPTISSGALSMGLNSATTSGFWEAQAVFSSSPVTLATVGDYINMSYTFTDTGSLLGSASGGGGTNSAIYTGLYDDAGTTPVAGSLNNSGLNTTSGSSYATGNAALWSGYVGRIAGDPGTTEIYSRPAQNGSGTTSANQDLIGNNFGGGAFNNPGGSLGTGNPTTSPSTAILTAGSQYTMNYEIQLTAANKLTITENLFSGAIWVGGVTNSFSSVTDTTFDGLAIGARNSGTSADPEMTINDIDITDEIQSVPEPGTLALAGIGAGLTLLVRFRRR